MRPVDAEGGTGVPVFFKADTEESRGVSWEDMTHVKFQTWNPLTQRQGTSLFSNPNEQAMQLPESSSSTSSINTDNPVPYDRDALQRKNASRKKFGMPPLSPEEFIAIEKEVRAMDEVNKKKATYLAEQFAQMPRMQRKNRRKIPSYRTYSVGR